jgi:hypothetical protein
MVSGYDFFAVTGIANTSIRSRAFRRDRLLL